jgi:hypothetical protein
MGLTFSITSVYLMDISSPAYRGILGVFPPLLTQVWEILGVSGDPRVLLPLFSPRYDPSGFLPFPHLGTGSSCYSLHFPPRYKRSSGSSLLFPPRDRRSSDPRLTQVKKILGIFTPFTGYERFSVPSLHSSPMQVQMILRVFLTILMHPSTGDPWSSLFCTTS